MKTFEEACKETFAHKPGSKEKQTGAARSEAVLEKHIGLIDEITESSITQEMVITYVRSVDSALASAIASAFVQGVVIGMLMEKQDGEIK